MAGQKMLGQFNNVVSTSPQRWNPQFDPGQPVIQVDTEASVGDQVAQTLIRWQ